MIMASRKNERGNQEFGWSWFATMLSFQFYERNLEFMTRRNTMYPVIHDTFWEIIFLFITKRIFLFHNKKETLNREIMSNIDIEIHLRNNV